MTAQEAGYQFARGLVAFWDAIAPIGGPILIVVVVLGFFNWVAGMSSGRRQQ